MNNHFLAAKEGGSFSSFLSFFRHRNLKEKEKPFSEIKMSRAAKKFHLRTF